MACLCPPPGHGAGPGDPGRACAAKLPSGFEAELQGGAPPASRSASRAAYSCWPRIRLSADDAVLLAAAARAVLGGGRGVAGRSARPPSPRRRTGTAATRPSRSIATEAAAPACQAARRLALLERPRAGSRADGREYVIVIDGASPGGPALPPAPWTNVLANPGFGCLVTEAGLGYTWAGNSQMNRLTPWSNDPGSDPPGEVIYLRDEERARSGRPRPCRGDRARPSPSATARATRATPTVSHRLDQDLLVLVPPDDPVKLVCLTVRNNGDRPRQPVGDVLCRMGARQPFARTPRCRWSASAIRKRGAVLARNAWAGSFAGQIAFVAAGPRSHSRSPPIAPNSSAAMVRVSAPAALGRAGLSGRVGAGARPVRGGDDADHRAGPRRDEGGRLRPGPGGEPESDGCNPFGCNSRVIVSP